MHLKTDQNPELPGISFWKLGKESFTLFFKWFEQGCNIELLPTVLRDLVLLYNHQKLQLNA